MNRYTEPDFTAVALITIDTQSDTLDGQPLEVRGTSAILPSMQRLVEAFRVRRLPIVHIVRLYRRDGSNVDLFRREAVESGKVMLAPDTPGCQLAPGLLPNGAPALDCKRLLAGGVQTVSELEVIMYKPRWGAFYQTPLDTHLRQMGVTTIVFTGCNFPNCPRASIVEAGERDFRVVVTRDAISGLDERAATEMQGVGAAVLSADEVLARLCQGAPRSPTLSESVNPSSNRL